MKHLKLARYPLGNPRRLWRQKEFVLSTFSPLRTDYRSGERVNEITARACETCRDAGFNLLELGWSTHEQGIAALEACERLGIGTVYQDLSRFGGMGGRVVNPCGEEVLDAVVADTAKYRNLVGYYIWDEPLSEEQLRETRRQMDLMEKKVPEKLLATVAIPSYNKEETWKNGGFPAYLRRFMEVIDPVFLTLDYYPIGMRIQHYEDHLDRMPMWCDLGLMKTVAEEYGVPMWFYYQGQNLLNAPVFTFPMVRLSMGAGVLYGAKGLQHYTAWESVVDPADGGHGEFFEEQKELHRAFSMLGNTLMALTCRRVTHDASLLPDCPSCGEKLSAPVSECKLLAGELPFRVSASEFEDAYGNDYLMILNRDYETEKEITVPLSRAFRAYRVSEKDGKQYPERKNTRTLTCRLAAGAIALYRLQPTEDEPCTVEYVLEERGC